MLAAIIICFILGYATIVFEHPLKLDKTVPALLMAALCWALLSLGHLPVIEIHEGQVVEAGHGQQSHEKDFICQSRCR